MPTRPVESTHEAEPNRPLPDPNSAGVESSSGDRMQGANSPTQPEAATAQPRRSSHEASRAEAGGTALPNTNEDDATSGDQDIDTAGTAHDDLSPTKSM